VLFNSLIGLKDAKIYKKSRTCLDRREVLTKTSLNIIGREKNRMKTFS